MTGRLDLSLSTLDTHVVYFHSSLLSPSNARNCETKLNPEYGTVCTSYKTTRHLINFVVDISLEFNLI